MRLIITLSVACLLLLMLWGVVHGASESGNTYNCEIEEAELESAPWTVTIRRVSPNGEVHFPGALLNPHTILFSFIRYVVAPGATWRLCIGAKYTVFPGHQWEEGGVTAVRVTPHPRLFWPGSGDGRWMSEANNLALLHLREPLQLSRILRPLCLPDSNTSALIQASGAGFMAGRNNGDRKKLTTLTIDFRSVAECVGLWRNITFANPFLDRACGYNMAVGTPSNPERRCIHADSGTVVRQGNRTLLVGFLNNFFSHKINDTTRICDHLALQIIYILNEDALGWIRRGMACGSANFACSDGSCIAGQKLCDGRPDCVDAGDEDERYCDARNCCDPKSEFACGLRGRCIRNASGAANCNGVQDCPSGEDESEETCPNVGRIRERNEATLIGVGLAASVGLLAVCAFALILYSRRQKFLSDEIIDEFLNGVPEGAETETVDGLLNIRSLRYDSAYEFEDNECLFVKGLGGGKFGRIRLARLKGVLVAVKSRKPTAQVDPDSFIALLAELKVMLFIKKEGGHANVVGFVGANTKDIRTYKLEVAMEYCAGGSLDSYLRENKDRFRATCVRTIDEFTTGFVARSGPSFTTVDLVKWSMHIAQGMEFLVSRRVIHSDLATRNVLLDADLTAKVCDFGLSHQLFGSSDMYTTKARLGFPWQWTAPEVLESSGREYNLKSDVWSYGITIWEVFTLGGEPWADIPEARVLRDWFRAGEAACPLPVKPAHSTHQIYEIMRSCWKLTPGARPDFSLLTAQMQYIYDRMCLEPVVEIVPPPPVRNEQGACVERVPLPPAKCPESGGMMAASRKPRYTTEEDLCAMGVRVVVPGEDSSPGSYVMLQELLTEDAPAGAN